MPQPDFNWLLNPNTPLSEVDTTAAEAAIGMGGMVGSPFALNNRLRLRDSERMARLQLGENLLQPYLQRDFAAQQQGQQIAAQAASDAMRESGAMARLSAEGQQRLQLALIQGDQQAADRLLTESGLDRRSAAGIAAGLQESTMRNQSALLSSLLPYAYGGKGGGAGASGGPTRYGVDTELSGPLGFNPVTASGTVPYRSPGSSNPNARGVGGSGGLNASLSPVLDKILASYGLS